LDTAGIAIFAGRQARPVDAVLLKSLGGRITLNFEALFPS
jgi:hypothetical protein